MDNNNILSPHALFWVSPLYGGESFTFSRREDLLFEGAIRLRQMKRARIIRRSFTTSTGIVVSTRNENIDPARFEGPLEMAFYICCDFDRSVRAYSDQPCEITYQDPTGKKRSYFPDALVWFRNAGPGKRRKPRLIEVIKTTTAESEGDLHKWQTEAGQAEAKVQGWDFAVMTEAEIYTPYWRNAKFLRRFESTEVPEFNSSKDTDLFMNLMEHGNPTTITQLLDDAADKRAAGENAARRFDIRNALIPILYHLIAQEFFFVDMSAELTLQSAVRRRRSDDEWYSPFQ